MPDPTIPRGRRTPPVLGPTIGRLVWRAEGEVVLAEDNGSVWPPGAYSIVQGFADGASALPRPWRYNTETGAVIVEGDMVLIDFIRGNVRCPVVRGVVRKTSNTDTDLSYDYRAGDIGNRRNVVVRYVDLDGNETGSVRVRALEQDGSVEITVTQGHVSLTVDGNASLTVDGDVTISATGDATVDADGDATLRAAGTVLVDGATIELGEAGQSVPLGESLVTWLATHTHPYVDTPVGASTTSPSLQATTGLVSAHVTVKS